VLSVGSPIDPPYEGRMLRSMILLPSPRPIRMIVLTVSLGVVALGGASCGSDDTSSVDITASPTSTASTVAATGAPPTAAATTVPPTTAAPTTPAPTTELTLDEATAMTETIINSWNTDDVSPIEELMGPKDVWIAITGVSFDETTIAGWLDPILVAIGDTERTGDPVEVTDGFSFPLVDVSSGGPFFLIITKSPDGVLTIEESAPAP
jgi:hypothetical protein